MWKGDRQSTRKRYIKKHSNCRAWLRAVRKCNSSTRCVGGERDHQVTGGRNPPWEGNAWPEATVTKRSQQNHSETLKTLNTRRFGGLPPPPTRKQLKIVKANQGFKYVQRMSTKFCFPHLHPIRTTWILLGKYLKFIPKYFPIFLCQFSKYTFNLFADLALGTFQAKIQGKRIPERKKSKCKDSDRRTWYGCPESQIQGYWSMAMPVVHFCDYFHSLEGDHLLKLGFIRQVACFTQRRPFWGHNSPVDAMLDKAWIRSMWHIPANVCWSLLIFVHRMLSRTVGKFSVVEGSMVSFSFFKRWL